MSELLVLAGIAAAALSGVPGLFTGRSSSVGQWISVFAAVIASGLGLASIIFFWATGESRPIDLPWAIPGAEFRVAIDGLSAIFLAPIFFVSLMCNIYGLGYWAQDEHQENGQKLRFFYGFLTAGTALLVVSRNTILFIFGWEMMALSAFFLVATEDNEEEVREAGWLYLVATHVATVCLFALFALMRATLGTFDLAPLPASISPEMATAMFVLALLGFGMKAGVMPLHVWLPSAHAAAPSHVSAIMSGVLIKMGIYGLVRITSLFPNPPWEWGAVVLVLGVASGILGVAFAIGQHDIKRLLAYHSIENIGIILLGLGLALIGRSAHRDDWVILGLAGCFLHVWNHALFKALLFLSAGSVIHQVHTREIDRLGGLAKNMPWTSLAFVVGAVAICGLPPLNGFVSEFMVYLGLLATLKGDGRSTFSIASLAAPALALIGALALACFVKVFGVVFLGTSRSDDANHAHESPLNMLFAMGALAACCLTIGLAPQFVAPLLSKGIAVWAPDRQLEESALAGLVPLNWISVMGWGLVAALLFASAGLWLLLQNNVLEYGPTWGCGYLAPTPRIQYTSSSFGEMLVGLFGWALCPRIHRPINLPLFPQEGSFHSEVPETVLDEGILPAVDFTAWVFSWFRVFQQGSIQTYLLYIFLTLIALLLWRP